LHVAGCEDLKIINLHDYVSFSAKEMNSYKDLEIYKLAFEFAVRVHRESLKHPGFELFELGSQVRRSTKSVKDPYPAPPPPCMLL
jgi:hypothetical protein